MKNEIHNGEGAPGIHKPIWKAVPPKHAYRLAAEALREAQNAVMHVEEAERLWNRSGPSAHALSLGKGGIREGQAVSKRLAEMVRCASQDGLVGDSKFDHF